MSPKIISSLFLALIFGLPLGQAGWEMWKGEAVQALEIVGPINETRLRAFEDDLRQASFMHQEVTPWYQLFLLTVFGRGNEKVIPGGDGELYFGENLDYITQPPFGRAGEEAIRDTIEDFARQLDAQGIDLILVPAPAKIASKPYNLSLWTVIQDNVESDRTRDLLTSLHGVHVWDGWDADSLGRGISFLPRDTHWSPRSMEGCAKSVGQLAQTILGERGVSLERRREWVAELQTHLGVGDLTELLRLPESHGVYEPMKLLLHRVLDAMTGEPFEPDRSAEVLLLGDSFTQIFSDPRLEMGEHAGFAEHLAKELEAPLDVIALAGGSARAVRESLARRPEGLSGKKLVIWQISIRDFNGDPSKWMKVLLPSGTKSKEGPANPVRVRAELTEVTRVPAEFDYEFCLAVHEYRVLEALEGTPPSGPLWVAHVALDEFEATPQAAYEVGAEHTLFLDDVALHHNLETTSWLDDTGADPRATIWFPTTEEQSRLRRLDLARAERELEGESKLDELPELPSGPKPGRLPSKGLELARAESERALQQRIAQIDQFGHSNELLDMCNYRLNHDGTRAWFAMDGWAPARNELALVRFLNTEPPAAPISQGSFQDTRRTEQPMSVILQYHRELQERGIDLLLVPIPGRVQVWSDRALGVPPDDPVHGGDRGLPELLLKMTSAGLNVVDVFPALACARAAAMAAGEADPDLFLTHNTHWAPLGVEACAAPIAEWIRAMDWFEQGPAREGHHFVRESVVMTDPSKMYGPGRTGQRELVYPRIVTKKGERPYRPGRPAVLRSPVLLIGDSFSSYHGEQYADIGLHVFSQIGYPVDKISLSQGAETAVWRSVARRADNLAGKKVVIWLFSANVLVSLDMTKVEIFTD